MAKKAHIPEKAIAHRWPKKRSPIYGQKSSYPRKSDRSYPRKSDRPYPPKKRSPTFLLKGDRPYPPKKRSPIYPRKSDRPSIPEKAIAHLSPKKAIAHLSPKKRSPISPKMRIWCVTLRSDSEQHPTKYRPPICLSICYLK